jgi:hypothetical protein
MFRSTILQSTRLARTPLARNIPPRSLLRPLSTTPRFFAQQTTAEGLPYPVQGNPEKPNPHADPQHVTRSAKEEAKAIVGDFAELIAGRSPKAAAAGAREMPHAQGSIEADFVSTRRKTCRVSVKSENPSVERNDDTSETRVAERQRSRRNNIATNTLCFDRKSSGAAK